jgi:hypothetical protein
VNFSILIYSQMFFFFLLVVVSSICAQRVVFFNTTQSNIPFGATVTYSISTPPSRGVILYNNAVLSSPFFASLGGLGYVPIDQYDFAYTSNATNTTLPYDSFIVLATIFDGPSITTQSLSVSLTLIDTSISIGNTLLALVGQVYKSPFTIIVNNFKDRRGTIDGILSNYAFRDPNTNTLLPSSGIQFNQTCTSLGCIINCDTNATLTQGITYPLVDFCISSTGVTGSQNISYQVVSNSKLISTPIQIQFTTSTIVLNCNPCGVTTREDTEISLNYTEFFQMYSDQSTTYQFIMDRDVTNGDILLQSGERVVVGISYSYPLVLFYLPPINYFNAYIYNTSVISSNFSFGSPLLYCLNPRIGDGVCVSSFSFHLQSNFQTFPIQEINFEVLRYIPIDIMSICTKDCLSIGDTISVNVVLQAYDNRIIQEPSVVLTSLPLNGQLIDINGYNVSIGVVYSSNNFTYMPNPGYFNRYRYLSYPNFTISQLNQYGVNLSVPYDFVSYYSKSSYYFNLTSSSGIMNIMVYTTDTDQLTACPQNDDISNPWNRSCVAYGTESNNAFGEYATPIYLSSGNVDMGEVLQYKILSTPRNGRLYINIGTFITPIYGNRVYVYTIINSSSLVYVGYQNYFNQVGNLYIDLSGNPVGGCSVLLSQGCPDIFTFTVLTSTGRISNIATYQIYILSLVSVPTFTNPNGSLIDSLMDIVPITYVDADRAQSFVYVEIISFDFIFGTPVYLPNYPPNNYTLPSCLNIFNCTDSIAFYALDVDVKPIVENIHVLLDPNSTIDDENILYINIYKRPITGLSLTDAYVRVSGDLVFGTSINLYALNISLDDYYFYGCGAAGCEKYYEADNKQIASDHQMTTGIVLTVVGSILVAFGGSMLLMAFIGIPIYSYCKKAKSTKVVVDNKNIMGDVETTVDGKIYRRLKPTKK